MCRHPLRYVLACLFAILAASPALAGVPTLLGDIDDAPGTRPSIPRSFVRLGDHLYFLAEDSQHGIALWRSDGTPAGTGLVIDLVPGPGTAQPFHQYDANYLVVVGDRLYFRAWDPAHGEELWTSDGTAEGTRLLLDIEPGPASSSPGLFATTPTGFYFAASDKAHGPELWRLDASGVRVIDIVAGTVGSSPQYLTTVGERVFFTRYAPTGGYRLWTCEGENAEEVVGAPPYPDTNFTGAGAKLFFSTYDPTVYELRRLWVVDAVSLQVTDLGRFGDMFFDRNPGFPLHFATGRELWKTDGTPAGTTVVFNGQVNGQGGFHLSDPLSVGTAVYFSGYHPSYGYELWKSEAGVTGVVDIVPGTGSSSAYPMMGAGGGVYFATRTYAYPNPTRAGLGWTNGASVQILADYREGPGYSGPGGGLALGDTYVFVVDDGQLGWEPWVSTVSSGVATPATLLLDIETEAHGSEPAGFVALGGWWYFSACDATHGWELWRTDGTAGGAALVADVYAGAQSSDPRWLTAMGGHVYFSAGTYEGRELWRTDGTSTTLVKDFSPDYGGGDPQELTVMAQRLYFSAVDPAFGRELWTSDGTEAGTRMLADVYVGTGSSEPRSLTGLGGQLLFSASTEYWAYGRELWKTDGSSVVLVKDIAAGQYSSSPSYLVRMGNRVYFQASDFASASGSGAELWATDGTADGTVLLGDILPGPGSSYPCALTAGDGVLYFTAWDPANGRELWTSDGTPGGTRLVANLFPDEVSGQPAYQCGGGLYYGELRALGRSALFSAWDPAAGFELWRSDGTAAGTGILKDIWAEGDSYPAGLTVAGGQAFFSAYHPLFGRELWTTDGTAIGTFLAADVAPGEWSSSPDRMSVTGDTILFQADDGQTGREPWTLEFSLPQASIEELIGGIQELIDQGTLKPGQGKSLISKLEQALDGLVGGDARKAVTMLEAFVHEVRAFENAGILDPAEADDMIALAQAAIASLTS